MRVARVDDAVGGSLGSCAVGWWTIFEAHAWRSAMGVEDRYYSMAPNSCVLTHVGHASSLRSSLDAVGAGWTTPTRRSGGRGAAGSGDAEGTAELSLQQEETVGAREESKSGGSNNVNNDSSGAPTKMSARVRATTTAAAVRTAAGARARAV